MKQILVILLFSLFGSAFAQQLKIDRIIHEFGIIPTWEGLHRTKFTVVNDTKHHQFYKELHSSCGCAVASVTKDTLLPGDTTFLYVIMDPSNEDGKFKKSLSIQFESDVKKIQTFYINLNGYGLTQKQLQSLQATNKQREANVKYFYQQTENIEKFDTKSNLYLDFIEQAKKEVLFNQYVKIQINIYSKSSDYAYEKVLKSIRKSLLKDLQKENVSEEKIIFGNPTAQLATDTNYIQLSIIENKRENNEFQPMLSPLDTNNNTPKKHTNYPTYVQLFTGGINYLDSNSGDFKTYFENLTSLLNPNKKLNILIFSSSSKAPNNVGYTPIQMSELRGKRVLKTFINTAIQNHIDTSLFNFRIIPIVGGPEFSTRHYFVEYFYNFQYVKLIATTESYIPKINVLTDVFKQYFYPGQTSTNTTTENFEVLVRNISKEIDRKGFTSLIIESSSSKIPTAQYRTCEVLAYARIKDFKKTLNALLYQEGIDFRKVIYSEERALVAGPAYNKNEPNSTYTPFQYIKVYVE